MAAMWNWGETDASSVASLLKICNLCLCRQNVINMVAVQTRSSFLSNIISGGNRKKKNVVASSSTLLIPNFMKICKLVQKLFRERGECTRSTLIHSSCAAAKSKLTSFNKSIVFWRLLRSGGSKDRANKALGSPISNNLAWSTSRSSGHLKISGTPSSSNTLCENHIAITLCS